MTTSNTLRRSILPVGTAAMMLVAGSPAFASDDDRRCEPSVIAANGATIAAYDALMVGDFVAPMQIVIRNEGQRACIGAVTFNARRSEDRLKGPRNATFAYLIVGETNVNDIVYDPQADRGTGIAVSIPAGGRITLRPQLRVADGQAGNAGRYLASIEARFREGGNGRRAEDDTNVDLVANAVPSVQANFVGSDGASPSVATLGLGELSNGLQRAIGIQLRANSDVEVTLTSENSGVLKRDGGDGTVRYDLSLGRSQFDLRQSDQARVDLGADSVRGLTQQIVVKVGEVDRARAGTYRDTVTIQVSAR